MQKDNISYKLHVIKLKKRKEHLYLDQVVYLVDLHLCFPQLPLVALHVTFQLQVVVLQAAN